MENEDQLLKEIYVKMAKLCSRTELCSPDIRKRIRELGGNSLMAEKIIAHLEEENFLNDERYVKSYIREKFRINKWGRIKIHYYLKMKGLNENMINEGWSEIDEEAYIALLLTTMKEKAKTIKNKDKYETMGQIIRFTHSKGFEPELIHRYLKLVTG